jgi:hypothetical protein
LLQNLSFMRPVLHDATEQRTYLAPGAMSLRQVAQTMEDAIPLTEIARKYRLR